MAILGRSMRERRRLTVLVDGFKDLGKPKSLYSRLQGAFGSTYGQYGCGIPLASKNLVHRSRSPRLRDLVSPARDNRDHPKRKGDRGLNMGDLWETC